MRSVQIHTMLTKSNISHLFTRLNVCSITMTDQEILSQLEQLPESLKQEVLDFMGYLSKKYNLPIRQQQPERKQFGKYRGSLETGLSLDEMDARISNELD